MPPSIAEIEANKLSLEKGKENYQIILKPLTLISLFCSFSKYNISDFPRSGLQII